MAYSIITPNSELEAINEILSAVGAPPTNSLDDENNLDIINAKAMLNRVSREVQSRGWDFNIRENVTLPSDVFSQKVAYSSNYLRVIGSEYKLINQDGYFFDKDNRTFISKISQQSLYNTGIIYWKLGRNAYKQISFRGKFEKFIHNIE